MEQSYPHYTVHSHRTIYLVGLSLSLALSGACSRQRPSNVAGSNGSRVLREIAVHVLPTRDAVLGIADLPDSTVLFFTRQAVFLHSYGQPPRLVCPQLVKAPLAARWRSDDSVIGIVDERLNSVLEASPRDSVCTPKFRLPKPEPRSDGFPERFIAAASNVHGWVFLHRVADTLIRVDATKYSGTSLWSVVLPFWISRPTDSAAAFLFASGTHTIVGSPYYPFPWMALDTSGKIQFTTDAYGDLRAVRWQSSASPNSWRSLSVLRLGSEYIQTLADLNSDERIFVSYALDGRALRERRLIAPMAFVASCREQSCLLALRRTDSLEMVWYH